jgi:hypothetical protein
MKTVPVPLNHPGLWTTIEQSQNAAYDQEAMTQYNVHTSPVTQEGDGVMPEWPYLSFGGVQPIPDKEYQQLGGGKDGTYCMKFNNNKSLGDANRMGNQLAPFKSPYWEEGRAHSTLPTVSPAESNTFFEGSISPHYAHPLSAAVPPHPALAPLVAKPPTTWLTILNWATIAILVIILLTNP